MLHLYWGVERNLNKYSKPYSDVTLGAFKHVGWPGLPHKLQQSLVSEQDVIFLAHAGYRHASQQLEKEDLRSDVSLLQCLRSNAAYMALQHEQLFKASHTQWQAQCDLF